MKNILESGVCDARMEVIIDNKYFVPWESKIEFDKEVKVEAAPIVTSEPQVTMSVKAQPIIKETPEPTLPTPTVKEEVQEKPKKRGGIQLIVDNKPKRKIKKENKNVESIIDDLNLLAKELH